MKVLSRGSLQRVSTPLNVGLLAISVGLLIWMNGVYVNADMLAFGHLSGSSWQMVQFNPAGEVLRTINAPLMTALLFGLATVSLVALACGLKLSGISGSGSDEFKESIMLAQRLDTAGAQLEGELASVTRLIGFHIDANTKYSGSLGHINRSLPSLTRPEQVRKVVMALIAENEKVQAEATTLKGNLENSKTQIEKLRTNLADAQQLGMRDPLTALNNRRWLDVNIVQVITEARDQQLPLCLVMADIDHFKRINDSFGHPVGDDVIQRFAKLLTKNIKGRDSAVRYGGEEFAIILPETKLDGATKLTEQIRSGLEAKKWVVTNGGQQLGTITASFGIAQLREGENAADLIGRADAKLYEAKRTGRNRIVSDEND